MVAGIERRLRTGAAYSITLWYPSSKVTATAGRGRDAPRDGGFERDDPPSIEREIACEIEDPDRHEQLGRVVPSRAVADRVVGDDGDAAPHRAGISRYRSLSPSTICSP